MRKKTHKQSAANVGFEATLWAAADKLRKGSPALQSSASAPPKREPPFPRADPALTNLAGLHHAASPGFENIESAFHRSRISVLLQRQPMPDGSAASRERILCPYPSDVAARTRARTLALMARGSEGHAAVMVARS